MSGAREFGNGGGYGGGENGHWEGEGGSFSYTGAAFGDGQGYGFGNQMHGDGWGNGGGAAWGEGDWPLEEEGKYGVGACPGGGEGNGWARKEDDMQALFVSILESI